MPEFIYSTHVTKRGPWLVSHDALRTLDQLIDEEWKRLESEREKEIDSLVEIKIQDSNPLDPESSEIDAEKCRDKARYAVLAREYKLERSSREIFIHFVGGKSLRATSFEEAMREPAVEQEEPSSFYLKLTSGRVTGEISLRRKYDELEIDVAPSTSQLARSLYSRLRDWSRANESPVWMKKWAEWNPLQWLLLCFLCGGFFSYWTVSATDSQSYRRDLRHLIENGLDKSHELKAIELMAAISSNAGYKGQGYSIPRRHFYILGCAFIVALILTFPPPTQIGLGKGNAKIVFWRWWARVVVITIPSAIFMTFIWPTVVDLIKNAFQS